MSRRMLPLLVLLVVFAVDAKASEPVFTLSEDGATFRYRSQPGDQPAVVAARFGVDRDGLAAFLAANGITDPTRVPVGHVYSVPNPLAARATEAEARAAALAAEADAARTEASALRGESAAQAARLGDLERRAADRERLVRLWPWVKILGIVAVLTVGGAVLVAYRSMREVRELGRHVIRLGEELDERRRAALAERQQAARRVLDLEESVRALEHELGARAAVRRPTGTH